MPESPLTHSRYPTQDDGPYGGEQIQAAVLDLERYVIPRFTDTTLRDLAYSLWTQGGGVLEDGMACRVAGVLYLRAGGAWVTRRELASITYRRNTGSVITGDAAAAPKVWAGVIAQNWGGLSYSVYSVDYTAAGFTETPTVTGSISGGNSYNVTSAIDSVTSTSCLFVARAAINISALIDAHVIAVGR